MNQYYKRREANKLYDRELWRVKNINEDNIICSKCLKIYISSKDDIGVKNPNYYYKNCKECRQYYNDYYKKKNIDYNKYKPRLF